jgi:hypothetical protein
MAYHVVNAVALESVVVYDANLYNTTMYTCCMLGRELPEMVLNFLKSLKSIRVFAISQLIFVPDIPTNTVQSCSLIAKS